MRVDEFSGLDQMTHATGALATVVGGIPGPPRQHIAQSLNTRIARENSLEYQNRASRQMGLPPMGPGRATAAVPNPRGYHVPPAWGQQGPAPGIIHHQARATQHARAAYDHSHAAAVKRSQGLHRDAAAHEQASKSHARAAQAHATAGADMQGAGGSGGSPYQGATSMNQPSLRDVTPDNYYEQPLGFLASQVSTGAAFTATSKPQNVFRPTRLLVSSVNSDLFTISNIRIGTDSQLVGTTVMPAQVFSEQAVGAAFLLGTANIGIEISIDGTNTDSGTQDFRAVMMGQTFK